MPKHHEGYEAEDRAGAAYVDYVVDRLRAEGRHVGTFTGRRAQHTYGDLWFGSRANASECKLQQRYHEIQKCYFEVAELVGGVMREWGVYGYLGATWWITGNYAHIYWFDIAELRTYARALPPSRIVTPKHRRSRGWVMDEHEMFPLIRRERHYDVIGNTGAPIADIPSSDIIVAADINWSVQ